MEEVDHYPEVLRHVGTETMQVWELHFLLEDFVQVTFKKIVAEYDVNCYPEVSAFSANIFPFH